MKEILNTLSEIEETANKIISDIDVEKKKRKAHYTEAFESYKQELSNECKQKLEKEKALIASEYEQEKAMLHASHETALKNLEQTITNQKKQMVHEIIASILSTY